MSNFPRKINRASPAVDWEMKFCAKTYQSEKNGSDGKRPQLAVLELLEEVERVKLVDFLDVAEDDVPLASQRLRNILPRELRKVVLEI